MPLPPVESESCRVSLIAVGSLITLVPQSLSNPKPDKCRWIWGVREASGTEMSAEMSRTCQKLKAAQPWPESLYNALTPLPPRHLATSTFNFNHYYYF
ncbi:hypothetical protein DFS34DRAFT_212807 [Phlyctochytrium arcticum]|nr:hypothetical protein DFS34DRAFT_212807 [Phlyctochytrium arcticum]